MRRLSLSALFLILAASAWADGLGDLKGQAGPGSGGAPSIPAAHAQSVRLKGCITEPTKNGGQRDQDQWMRNSIDDALKMVDSCLVNYNKGAMARKIKSEFKNFEFSCSQEPSGHGGITHHEGDKAYIAMTMHSRLIQYSLPARVFHEMIHAIDRPSSKTAAQQDRDGHFIISQDKHAEAGFPDAVYGCQFACYGGGLGDEVSDTEAKAVGRYNQQLINAGGEPVPLFDENKFVCPEGAPDCKKSEHYSELLTYAYLCDTAKPFAPKDIVAKAHKAEAPKCIAEKLLNESCDAIDKAKNCPAKKSLGPLCPLKCEILQAIDGSGENPNDVVTKMMGIGKTLADAYPGAKGLDGDDKALYQAADKKHLIKPCVE